MTEISIGIIEAGPIPESVAQQYGQYADMYRALLSMCVPKFSYKTFAIYHGEMPSDISECDAWLVSGSRSSACDDDAWIAELAAFLVKAHSAQIPLIGICFGHQILAKALGCKVERSTKGWGLGIHHYDILQSRPWLTGDPAGFAIHAFHQDQVTEVPTDCDVLASSEFCPYAMLGYGESAISIQGHPEFSTDLVRQFINARRGKGVPEIVADKVLQSLPATTPSDAQDASAPPESERIAHWVGNFLTARLGAQS